MKRLSVAVGMILVFLGVCRVADASIAFNGHFYDVVVDQQASWDQAKAASAGLGGYLVAITSAEEQQFVESLLLSGGFPSGGYWIGLREVTEGVYVWDNGEPLAYTHWYPGEPNNGWGDEDRGQMLWTSDSDLDSYYEPRRGFWNDIRNAGWDPPPPCRLLIFRGPGTWWSPPSRSPRPSWCGPSSRLWPSPSGGADGPEYPEESETRAARVRQPLRTGKPGDCPDR